MKPPEISVVMATRDAAAYVRRSLESLAHQEAAPESEVILADGSSDGTAELIRTAFPHVRLVECRRGAAAPELLLEALRVAQGRIVVVTEPYCRFPPGWLQRLRDAHDSEFDVIGGAVEFSSRSPVDWACYIADYGAFLPSSPKRETAVLAGNHVSYKREVVTRALDTMADGFRKTFFHWELERHGARFLFEPELVVYWERHNTFGECMRRFFRNGRDFAATRSKSISRAERIPRVLTAPLLPPLLLYRRLRPVLARRDYAPRLLLSLPLITAFVTAWSAGEFLGYWNGPSATAQVEASRAGGARHGVPLR